MIDPNLISLERLKAAGYKVRDNTALELEIASFYTYDDPWVDRYLHGLSKPARKAAEVEDCWGWYEWDRRYDWSG